MEKEKYHAKKPEYKLGNGTLEVKEDLEYVDNILKDLRLDADPGVRGLILDIAYTLARDKLVEANRFAKLANRTNLTVADMKMADLENTEELKDCLQTLRNQEVAQEVLPKPCMEKGLMLPNWRNCQVGVQPDLQEHEVKPKPKVIQSRPMIRRVAVQRPHVIPPASTLGINGGANLPVIASTSKGAAPFMARSESSRTGGSPPPFAKKARPN